MRITLSILSVVVSLAMTTQPQASVIVTDIGTTPNGLTSYGRSISNVGLATGNVDTPICCFGNTTSNAFLYSNGSMNDLGEGFGASINDQGQITGHTNANVAFLYSNGSFQSIGSLNSSGSGSQGWGINNAEQVAGWSYIDSVGAAVQRAFLYANGSMQDIGTLGGVNSVGLGINEVGQITGFADTKTDWHAFIYANGAMQDLGTFQGGHYSRGEAINNAGWVTGYAYLADDATYHAFLYMNGIMLDLGVLPGAYTSSGLGINDDGYVVGWADGSIPGGRNAFLYSSALGMINLNDLLPPNSGWFLETAEDINDNGDILGWGSFNGKRTTYIMTGAAPSPSPEPMPEPSVLALVFIGLLLIRLVSSRSGPERAYRL